jgi:hypothetical protein
MLEGKDRIWVRTQKAIYHPIDDVVKRDVAQNWLVWDFSLNPMQISVKNGIEERHDILIS